MSAARSGRGRPAGRRTPPAAARREPRASPARPLWGWNRLDDRTAARIVAAADVRRGDLVLDLGAGTGALTRPLVAAGARVLAVELHRGRADLLRRRFAAHDVTVWEGDLAVLRYPREPFAVVANPPWASTDTLRGRLLGQPALRRADLVVPRWQAERWAAADRRITLGSGVRAEAFTPAAPCGAVVAVLRRVPSAR